MTTMTTKAKSGYLRMLTAWPPPNWKQAIDGEFSDAIVYKIVEVARGTPAELAALADPDAPKIEVVPTCDASTARVRCGDWIYDIKTAEWNYLGSVIPIDIANSIAALLRKHKDFPQPSDGGEG